VGRRGRRVSNGRKIEARGYLFSIKISLIYPKTKGAGSNARFISGTQRIDRAQQKQTIQQYKIQQYKKEIENKSFQSPFYISPGRKLIGENLFSSAFNLYIHAGGYF
jgi:hypothetical protein